MNKENTTRLRGYGHELRLALDVCEILRVRLMEIVRSSKMKHHVAIALWDSSLLTASQTIDALATSGIDVITINSSLKRAIGTDISSPNIFIEQVKKAVRSCPEGDYFFTYISGDVSSSNWGSYIQRLTQVITALDPFVYAPYLTSEGYPREFVHLTADLESADLDIACMTDGLVFSLHPTIVQELKNFFAYLDAQNARFTVGWGLDWIWCLLAIHHQKYIIRDVAMPLLHPSGTSYDKSQAKEEFHQVINFFLDYRHQLDGSDTQFRKYIYMINERFKNNPKFLQANAFFPKVGSI